MEVAGCSLELLQGNDLSDVTIYHSARREFEPERLPPRITFRTVITSLGVPNHILLTLFRDFGNLSRAT